MVLEGPDYADLQRTSEHSSSQKALKTRASDLKKVRGDIHNTSAMQNHSKFTTIQQFFDNLDFFTLAILGIRTSKVY